MSGRGTSGPVAACCSALATLAVLAPAAAADAPTQRAAAGGGDHTAPRTTIESGPAPVVRRGRLTFSFRADEPGATFACRLDDGGYKPCRSPYTTGPLKQGDHVFGVRATDPAGNVEATPAERRFSVDKSIAGANAAARRVQRPRGGRVAIVISVRSGEQTRVRAAGKVRVGERRFRVRSRWIRLSAGAVRRLRLVPVRPRASRRIRKALGRGKRARAKLAVTFVDLIGNRAISGEVDVRVKEPRARPGHGRRG